MQADDYMYRDALPDGLARRRGAGLNPGNRFEPVRLHVCGEMLDEGVGTASTHRQAQIFSDKTQNILNRVARTSDVPFDWTLNPYRGCEHGCIYCFARPYHEYLGFSCGLDFETKIVAKHEAPQLLVKALAKPSWKGEPIVMSAITDIYQPIEKQLRLGRSCLEVMADCGQPVSTMTKGSLVLRDTDLWARKSADNTGRVTVTLVTLDHALALAMEPRAASPSRRLQVIRALTQAGVTVTVNIAPVIPGLTDQEVPAILEAVADAGAKRVAWAMLKLPYQIKDLFLDWLKRCVPDRVHRVESSMRQIYGGKLYDADRVMRWRGQGVRAKQVAQVFDVFVRRYGLNRSLAPLSRSAFRPPRFDEQGGLFDA